MTESDNLAFGKPIDRWFGGTLRFNGLPPAGYEWISEKSTILVYKHYIAAIPSSETSGSMDKAISFSSFSLPTAVVGAGLALIKNVVNDIKNKDFEMSADVAKKLFEDRLLLWCRKVDTQIWSYVEKPQFFIKASSEILYCPFNAKDAKLKTYNYIWVQPIHGGTGFKPDIKAIGAPIIVKATNLKESEVLEVMEDSIKNAG